MNEIRLAGELETAGMIHDIGMMTIFSEMIGKPGKLAWFESQLLHEHPLVGYELVKKVPFPRPIAKAILEHHERLDGSGYPLGLKGDEISIGGKILAVAEVVSAMSFYRIYRDDYGVEVALNEIEKEADRFYDSDVVGACLKCFEEGFEF
nr:HD domain-containing phosphohydrolase [Mesotoga infera]